MAGIGTITLDNAGAVTAPTSLPLALGTQDTVRTGRHGLVSIAQMPAERGLMFADGVSPLRHYITSVLGTGLLAPSTAPTVASSGTAASTRLDTDDGGAYAIADGDLMYLIYAAIPYGQQGKIIFRTTLSAYPIASEVLIGGSTSQALANLKKFINQTGVEGVDYFTYFDFSSALVAGTITSTDLTISATSAGTSANSYVCTWSGGAGPRFEQASANVAQTVFSGGAAPTGTTPEGGVFQYGYTYVREDDGAESGISTTVEIDNGSGGQVNLTGMTASTDASVDYNRVYRTTVGGGLFYRVDEVAAAATTFNDTISDSTITAFGAVGYDERLTRSYRAGMPPKGRYLARFQGRWFTAGARLSVPYQSGTASVTNASATVTLTGGYVRTEHLFRTFSVASVSETYTILAVDETANTYTIDRAYEGSTNASATYTVKDLRDPYEVFWSEPGLPNAWPVQNSLKAVTSPDGQGITGLYAAYESLIIFTRQNVWRLTGSDGIYQAHLVSDKCGAVSGHAIVMDGGRMYWLGEDGVWGWTGSGEPVNMTSPEDDGTGRGQDDTMARLSMLHAHRAVAVLDQVEKEIRFYLPLDGDRTNRYVLVMDTGTGGWALDTCEDVTAAVTIQGPDGTDISLEGDMTGAIYHYGLSTADVAFGFEPVATSNANTSRTASIASAVLPTSDNGLWGAPVWHKSSDGTFTRACVATNTSTVVTYRRYLATTPSVGTQHVYGGILLWVQTGRCDFGDRARTKILRAMTISHSPESDGQYFFISAYGQGDFVVPTVGWMAGDLTVGNTANDYGPRRTFRVRKDAVLHGWGLVCLEPGCEARFAAATAEMVV